MPKNASLKIIKCEVFSRVVGYHRPIQSWNAGKQAEFNQRNTFNEGKSVTSNFGSGRFIKESIKTNL